MGREKALEREEFFFKGLAKLVPKSSWGGVLTLVPSWFSCCLAGRGHWDFLGPECPHLLNES